MRPVVQLIRRLAVRRSGSSALALVLIVPLVANAIRALTLGWFPTYDIGFLQLRALDVGTRRTPLVGMPSTLSEVSGVTTFHPGPLQSWMSALPLRMFSFVPSALMLTQVLLNMIWVLLVVHVLGRSEWARHRAVAAIVGLVFLVSLGPEIAHDPWNPHAAVIPLALAILATMLVVLGQRSIAWVAVLAGSFAAQCHLSFAAVGAISVVLAVAFSVVAARRGDSLARRDAWIAVGVFVLCWIGPIIDQFTGHGNLGRLIGGGVGGESLGLHESWFRFVRVLLPWRLLFDVHVSPQELVSSVSWWESVVAVVALLGLVWLASRDRGRIRPVGCVIVSMVAAQLVITAMMPVTLGTLFGLHLMRAWWPIVVAFWVIIVIALLGRLEPRQWWVHIPSWSLVGAAVVVVTTVSALYGPTDVRDGGWYRPTSAVADEIDRSTANRRYDFRTLGFAVESPLGVGLVADLVRRGYDIRVDQSITPGLLADARTSVGGVSDGVITVVMSHDNEIVDAPEGRLLVWRTFTVHERDDVEYDLRVYLG